MKKKLLGLGVCALALGVVAGAVSARSAIEAKADAAHSWAICGSLNGADWANDIQTFSYSVVEEVGIHKLRIELKKDDKFKFRADEAWDIEASWQFADLLNNSSLLSKDGGDLVAGVNGTYTFTIKDSADASKLAWDAELHYQDYITVNVVPDYVLSAKVGDAALALSPIDPDDGTMIKQFEATVTASKGAILTLYAGEDKITSNLNHSEGSSFLYTDSGNYVLHNDIAAQKVYFKVWESGWISVYGAGYVAGATGYYLVTASGSWAPEAGIKSNGPSGDNVATFINVDLAKDEEFTIAKFDDGERPAAGDWQYDAGWSNVADGEHGSGAYASFEAGASDNHIKVKTAGQYCIYVHEDKATFINEYEVTQADYDAVDTFVANYITEQAKPETGSGTCEAKYTAAATALAALTEVRQDLFWNDAKYASARAVYEYWRDHRADNSIFNISGVEKNNNTGLVITLVALGGAAVLGMGVYFASRKRKSK